MINPAHVVEHLVKLVRTRFGDDNQSPPTDEERELANHLFEIIIELDNGTAVLETDWTLTHDTDGHDTVEEEDNEDEPSQNSQEWETLSMLSVKGEKSTSAVKESKNKQTHSYTIQPIVSMSGKLISALLICLQEQDANLENYRNHSLSYGQMRFSINLVNLKVFSC
ncbi:hypothetical protein Fcan01_06699 [Folsomia candida]|uniref:Uncharacterized protein n=1 Tax=Folsomia candida TaxID=158441 RepID=A0A226EIR3_FOLCA|nr:hypothetical protein Fcan01_06699 [Folsomia candida]